MADTKISALTSYTTPIATDIVPVVDITTTTTKKMAIGYISAYTAVVTTAINRAASTSDVVILVDGTSLAITITLPTAVGVTGRRFEIKDWKGQAATRNITIATTSAQTIDGAGSKTINTNYASMTVVSDGANWSVI